MRTALIAALAAILGGTLGAVLGDIATKALRVSNFEGARGYAVVFVCIPLGLVLGLVVGIVVARTMGAAPWWKATGAALLATAVAGGAITGVTLLLAPHAPTLDGEELDLVIEIRMPAGRTAPDPGDYRFNAMLISSNNSKGRISARLDPAHPGESEGRVVIPGRIWLAETTVNRALALNDGDEGYWFAVDLPARPTAADREWSEWSPAPGAGRETGGFQIRWKVATSE